MAATVAPSSPIPSISISFAPPEDIPAEPYSPFGNMSFGINDCDSPRAIHLAPPMTGSPRHPSPLSGGARRTPAAGGKGLDRARFESLLRNTRERAPKIFEPPLQSPRKPMPSLDQISARIHSQARQQPGPKRVRLPIGAAPVPVRAPIPLPAFLRSQQRSPSPPTPTSQAIPVSPAAPARLHLPALPRNASRCPTPPPAPHPRFNERVTVLPAAPAAQQLRSRRVSEYGTTAITQANLSLLESRNEMSKAMLEKIMRRLSSPAELERAGRRNGEVFGEHRVLAMPGGF